MKLNKVMALLLVAFTSTSVIADGISLTGKWKLVTDVAGVHRERSCSFEQKGTSFTGDCKSDDGSVSVTGSLTGEKVTFQYDADVLGQKIAAVCDGKINGSTVVGTLTLPALGLSGDCSVTH